MTKATNNRLKIMEDVKKYWEVRSESYSRQNIAELHSFKKDAWKNIIIENAPQKETLKILDVGTGPGFFAINLAMEGHCVTAVDCTKGMIEKAKRNAEAYGVEVTFEIANAQELPFADESFDLVVSRNVLWNLEQPQKALEEWGRVLTEDGRLLYYDANWYLHLFDEELKELHIKSQMEAEKYLTEPAPESKIGHKMEELAFKLPLSKLNRPEWDINAIEKSGLKLLKVDNDVGSRVWEKIERIKYSASPMFMVCAEKS
ncbi:class I SAM-dependent methyltransferase [Alkalibacter mobilis]|uniref:class I SAM-dependent methyltransferase n=1 Tax=Alkalibacter mobilis TaxID=2787712 RepID=UPI00189D7A6B|nr:class I SAM-dependent methyltransferase [Alkalibacter mobilis]MBF7096247.1 class I SAM-dependent methyltransferase [Alkalibacter mobilis]